MVETVEGHEVWEFDGQIFFQVGLNAVVGRDTLDAIFRVAHSVKGMAATMGYDQVAALTHNMEDVFSLLRERAEGLPKEAVDVLFACLDMLGTLVNEIEADGASKTDPGPLIDSLKGLVRDNDAVVAAGAAPGASTSSPGAAGVGKYGWNGG